MIKASRVTGSSYSIMMADLMTVLMITFLASLGVLAPLVYSEVLTYIEQVKTDKKSDINAPQRSESQLLEISYLEKGKYFYHFHNKGKKQTIATYSEMVDWLNKNRPQVLRVRIDRRVESGIYQDVILDTGKLNIRIWQDNQALQ